MPGNVTTLYIDDSNIRLLVMAGKRIKRRAELPLEAGLVENGVVLREDDVAALIKEFMHEKGVKAKKVIVGMSGLHNMTRPIELPKLDKELLPEAVLREAKRVMPISAEQFYFMWQVIPSDAGKTSVFVSALRIRSTDSVINTVKKAGLNAVALDLKPLAITRLVREKTAIIIDVQPKEFDIVIMSEGVPQPIRTMPFPGDSLLWPEKLMFIRTELDRTIEFFNTNNPEKELGDDMPVHISGQLASTPELEPYLEEELGHPVVPLSTRLKAVKDVNYNNFMTNVGLAMLDASLEKRAGPSVVTESVLPPVYRPKPISIVRLIALPATITIIVLLVPMLILARSTSANIESLNTQIDTVNRLILQEQNKKNEMKRALNEAQTTYELYATALDKMDFQQKQVNTNLDTTFDKLDVTISLKSVKVVNGTLVIEGWAGLEEDILAYARALEKSSRFNEVIVSSIKTMECGDKEFLLTLLTEGWDY